HVSTYRFVELVSANPQAAAEDDAGQRDDCDFASTAADINDHIARGLMDRQTNADRRGHGLLNQVNLPRTGMGGRVLDCTFLHFSDARRNGHHDTWRDELPVMNLLNEVTEHRLGNFEICDDPVFHRADSHDVTRSAPQHPL